MANDFQKDDPSHLTLRQRLRFLAKDSILYGGAAAFSKAFSLITFPLLARYFSVEDFGLIDFFTIIAGLLAIFFVFGQDSAVARFFYEYKNRESRCQLISQSLVLQMGFVVLMLPLLWFISGQLANRLSNAPESELLLKIILLQVPFLLLINFSQNLLKWTFTRSRFLIISLGSVIFNVLLLLIAILVFKIGVVGVFLVSLAVKTFFGLLGLFFVKNWIVLPKGFAFLQKLLPFAIPYGVICCIGAFVPVLERSLVNSLLGEYDLGLYAAGTKIAMLVALVSQAFQMAWGPFSLAIYKEPDTAHTYNWVLKSFALGICVAVLFLAAIARPAILLFASDRYMESAIVVFPLAMGLAIQATSGITGIGISLSRKSYLSLYSYVIFLAVTAISIYFLATVYGLLGVALGVMIGHIARALSASWLAQCAYPLSWPFGPVLTFITGTIAIGLFGTWAGMEISSFAGSAIYTFGAMALPVAGWFLLFNTTERHILKSNMLAVRFYFAFRCKK